MTQPHDGLSDAHKLQARVKQICRKLGINLASTSFVLTEEHGDLVNLKIVLPPELFADQDEASVKIRDEFADIMEDFGSIDMDETVSMDTLEPKRFEAIEEEDDEWW